MYKLIIFLFYGFVVPQALAQPDVVVIVADDLGYGDVGYNGSDIRTPNLDRLAAEGVVLDRFYTASQCSPSRAALLTGRYGIRMGISEPLTWADTLGLPSREETLAELLQATGYETAMVGKWHLGRRCHQHPIRHGFDSFVGLLGGGAGYFSRGTPAGLDWWRGLQPERVEGYTTDLIAEEAVRLLRRRRQSPLFLYVPFSASHGPLDARPEDLAQYERTPEPRRRFAAMTTRLDWAIGQVMEAVRASGRPTLVWVLSDNGGHPAHGGSNGPLRGWKGQSLEGGIRVPSVVWYPPLGHRTVEHPVWSLDVLPTIGELVGASPSGLALDGVSQRAQLAGAPPTRALLDRVFITFRRSPESGFWASAQTADWKYVLHPDRPGPPEELYHIGLDPTEAADSLSAYPARASELRERAFAFAALVGPGATHDASLTEDFVVDFSPCGGGVAPPSPPSAEASAATPEGTGSVIVLTLLGAACVAFALLVVRSRR